MPIIFEGDPPFEPLDAHTPTATPTKIGVEMVVNVYIEAPPAASFPVRILLTPEDAAALAQALGIAAPVVRRWRDQ